MDAFKVKDKLTDQVAACIEGRIGEMLDACMKDGIMTDNYKRFTRAYTEKLDSEGLFTGEFWGKWFTSAAPAARYRPTAENMVIVDDAVKMLLSAQEPTGRLSASATDFTTWDLWGRKYVLLGLVARYDLAADELGCKALSAAAAALDDIIAHTRDAGVKITETGLAALQAESSCSILQPVVQIYLRTGEKRFLDFAEYLVDLWSQPSAFNPRGMRLIEDSLDGVAPINIAAPKGYEIMSCWEGVCELYRATGNEKYLHAALAYMNLVQEREAMITGSGSSGELWCDGRLRQTQMLEAPMETCVTATYMKICHQLLRLTGCAAWADQMEISLFNALAGAMKKDGSWWAYFSPLQGCRVPSQIQIADMNSSCCVVNGPRALTEVTQWAVMGRSDGAAVCLYQTGEYPCEGGWFIRQKTDYPHGETVTLTVDRAPAKEATLALRIPAWSQNTVLSLNGQPVDLCTALQDGWCCLSRRWQTGDTLILTLDLSPRIVDAPANPVYKAVMVGPLVLGMDEKYTRMPENTPLWLMNDTMQRLHDDTLKVDYYRAQSVDDAGHTPFIRPVSLEDGKTGYAVRFLHRPVHFFDHKELELTFLDYADCGDMEDAGRAMRVWFPVPLYTADIFPPHSRKTVNPFSNDSDTL